MYEVAGIGRHAMQGAASERVERRLQRRAMCSGSDADVARNENPRIALMNPTVIARRCLVFGLSVGLTLYAGRVVSQPRRRRLIATLGGGSVSSSAAQWEAFRQTLRHLGYGAED